MAIPKAGIGMLAIDPGKVTGCAWTNGVDETVTFTITLGEGMWSKRLARLLGGLEEARTGSVTTKPMPFDFIMVEEGGWGGTKQVEDKRTGGVRLINVKADIKALSYQVGVIYCFGGARDLPVVAVTMPLLVSGSRKKGSEMDAAELKAAELDGKLWTVIVTCSTCKAKWRGRFTNVDYDSGDRYTEESMDKMVGRIKRDIDGCPDCTGEKVRFVADPPGDLVKEASHGES